jgi:hypothetical protein
VRESELSRRLALGPMSRTLIQLGHRVTRLSARTFAVTSESSTRGGTAHCETCRGCGPAKRLERTRCPVPGLYTHSEERGASCNRQSGPGPETAPFTAASTPTLRSCLLGASETRKQTVSLSASLLAIRHRLGVAVTLVSADIARTSVGDNALARSSRADQRSSRKPRSLPGLLVHPCRQTACATVTRLTDPSLSDCQRTGNVKACASSARCAGHRAASCAGSVPEGSHLAFVPLTRHAHDVVTANSRDALRLARLAAGFQPLAASRATPKGTRLSSGHSGETSTTSQERVFRSFP